jgi:small subunit ribosomal protein S5
MEVPSGGNAPRGRRRDGGSEERPEFDQRIIDIRRVARVVAGGRRFSFSVAMVIGNRKGSVGVGLGKGGDTQLAIAKALRQAKKELVMVKLNKKGSISSETSAKYNAARVMIKPAPGRGLVAGSSVRAVLELCGIKDVSGKILSKSKNSLNNARAAVVALSELPA